MSNVQIPGLTPVPSVDHRVQSALNSQRRSGDRSRYERENDGADADASQAGGDEAGRTPPGTAGPRDPIDPGDGTGQRVNVTA